jgi:hypothetical protein
MTQSVELEELYKDDIRPLADGSVEVRLRLKGPTSAEWLRHWDPAVFLSKAKNPILEKLAPKIELSKAGGKQVVYFRAATKEDAVGMFILVRDTLLREVSRLLGESEKREADSLAKNAEIARLNTENATAIAQALLDASKTK